MTVLEIEFFPDDVGKKCCHLLGTHTCDVDDKVVVVGIVARFAGYILDKGVAFVVDVVDDFLGFFSAEILFAGNTVDTCVLISDDEDVHRIGLIMEDMETCTANDDATFLCGQFS